MDNLAFTMLSKGECDDFKLHIDEVKLSFRCKKRNMFGFRSGLSFRSKLLFSPFYVMVQISCILSMQRHAKSAFKNSTINKRGIVCVDLMDGLHSKELIDVKKCGNDDAIQFYYNGNPIQPIRKNFVE